ncbi:DUF2848 domain-containing protein [Candidimonas sp. SYP-B2681]|uniref:DUF2848 domain-containing protein n=1 Tax=Candidimonas sp. SYP-B2681 TaxID=2497686 RepID=UPI000F8647C0|nr:DUF2848 domain-containing protein [Candidimonas sp. SYP-B2681]RTZ41700.1 DUF2848 domain-containing protein [Candidimonas sp. SYP-B2681]
MKLSFNVASDSGSEDVSVNITTCIVAGWAGRDQAAIEHHIEELAELGVPRPSAVPLYYRIASNQLSQESEIEVVGNGSSGEAEVFVFSHGGEMLVSLASDHTDRKLETHSVALSKQLCAKPVAVDAWRYADVADHWDELVLRSWIEENGNKVLYQEGTLATLRHPSDLIQGHFAQSTMPEHAGMTCGTVNAIGGIRPSTSFDMELFDPHRQRSIRHKYAIKILPEIA